MTIKALEANDTYAQAAHTLAMFTEIAERADIEARDAKRVAEVKGTPKNVTEARRALVETVEAKAAAEDAKIEVQDRARELVEAVAGVVLPNSPVEAGDTKNVAEARKVLVEAVDVAA